MTRCFWIAFFLLPGWLALPAQAEVRKSEVVAQCGDVIESEFTAATEQHAYMITMAPGDVLDFSVIPIGDFLKFWVSVLEPAGNEIHRVGNVREAMGYTSLVHTLSLKTGVLSGRGSYRIRVVNYNRSPGNFGLYTIHIGCTLRDGTVIEPGARPSSPPTPPTSPSPTPSPKPSPPKVPADFKGFPGLGPIDFSGSAFPKLSLGIPLEGTISTGGEVFGYRFDAKQGDSVELNFKKASGNLNLGLVLLDQRGKVVFHSSLVTTKTLAALLELPTTGEYTLGVARIELLPPSAPLVTSFTIETIKVQ